MNINKWVVKAFLSVVVLITMQFSITSCMNRKDIDLNENSIFSLSDWTYSGDKKTNMTIDDFQAVVDECKTLYAASQNIDFSFDGEKTDIRKTINISDPGTVSREQYNQYLDDILTMVSYRLSCICDENLRFDEMEWRKDLNLEDAKNSLIYLQSFFVSDPLESEEMTTNERIKKLLYESDKTPSLALLYGYKNGKKVFYSASYWDAAENKENAQSKEIFPGAAENSVLNEIQNRESTTPNK